MIRVTLTKKFIEQDAKAPVDQTRAYYYDAKVRTLVLAVSPKGRKTFTWYKKLKGGATRLNIGTFPEWTIEKARGKASEWNAMAAHGQNPACEISRRSRASSPTASGGDEPWHVVGRAQRAPRAH